MFRSAELVAIKWEHIHFCSQGGVMVFVLQSKTDQGRDHGRSYSEGRINNNNKHLRCGNRKGPLGSHARGMPYEGP